MSVQERKNIMMRLFVILLLTILTLTGCSKSPLSDVDIMDPSLLKVKVKIEQNSYNDKEVQVFIRDKNNNPVELLNGKVLVNGHRVSFDRASVHAAGTRGYIYTPSNSEQEFQISIFWNAYDNYSFILCRETGWPGFYCNSYNSCHQCNECDEHTISNRYELKGAPFYHHEIVVSYTIQDGY